MEIKYTDEAKEDLLFWKTLGQVSVMKKISSLIDSIQLTPYAGIGKPEGLKYNFSGYWSRRINQEHRLIYEVFEDYVLIHSLRGHYL